VFSSGSAPERSGTDARFAALDGGSGAGVRIVAAVPWTHRLLFAVPDLLAPLASELAWVGHDAQTLPSLLAGLGGGILAVLALMVIVAIGFVPIGQILGRAVRRASETATRVLVERAREPRSASGASRSASLVGLGPTAWIAIAGVLMVPFLEPAFPASRSSR
jgi:hypothetical protein